MPQLILVVEVMVEREGFEPSKAIAGRFTVCSLWPLGYRPQNPILATLGTNKSFWLTPI